MKRFLVVGCGGSGGSTLAYMMDHLKGVLKTRGIDRLPGGWQFVHVDVPVVADSSPDGLQKVKEVQGGEYVPTGTSSPQYAIVDDAVASQLATGHAPGALGLIGSWAPKNPQAVPVPVQIGAGQYRAIGRMITLTHVVDVYNRLSQAQERTVGSDAQSEMARVAKEFPGFGDYDPDDSLVALVVASMAGGAGASMALDVCRILTSVQGIDAKQTGVFMFTADAFETLPVGARLGVGPNSLAMLGEIVAAQTGAAGKHDAELLTTLGVNGVGASIPFARVFPVGRHMGGNGAILGEGRPKDVYRALGRGLASLMTSGSVALNDFISFDLGNPAAPAYDERYFGWGSEDTAALRWHSFGFASLSTGRDRYEHYAAQRLARSCVDRVLYGHRLPGNPMGDQDRIRLLADSQWGQFVTQIGLPGARSMDQIKSWLNEVAFPRDHVSQVNAAAGGVRAVIPPVAGQNGAQWRAFLQTRMNSYRRTLVGATEALATSYAWAWHKSLLENTKAVTAEMVSHLGLPFAKEMLTRLSQHVTEYIGKELRERPQTVDDPTVPDASAKEMLNTLSKAKIEGNVGDALINTIMRSVRNRSRAMVEERATVKMGQVLNSYVKGVLSPLIVALGEAQRMLEQEVGKTAAGLGVADLKTDVYQAWPADGEMAPAERFSSAQNEVLLTDAADFIGQYQADVATALGRQADSVTATDVVSRVLSQVIQGEWDTTSQIYLPPRDLLEQTRTWHADAFRTDLHGNPVIPQDAAFGFNLSPDAVLSRATGFIRRPNESFDKFVSLSLRDYAVAADAGGAKSVIAQRAASIQEAFNEVLDLSKPLVGASNEVVQRLYSGAAVGGLTYRYKFSAVPFDLLPISETLLTCLSAVGIDDSSRTNLNNASDQSVVRSISVFCSYDKYPPLAFNSVLDPVVAQWVSEPGAYARRAFWLWRRSRPLPAALPLSDADRHAMVAGWYVARIVGDLVIPDAQPPTGPVKVWSDADGTWLPFPNPLLTPPESFTPIDWLPSVLESLLLAVAASSSYPVLQSLTPYRVLREKFDTGYGPVQDGKVQTFAAVGRLADWLRTGRSFSGGVSAVSGLTQASNISDRVTQAKEFLSSWAQTVSQFLPGGKNSNPPNRGAAARLPMLYEIADDVYQATRQITELLDQAADIAIQDPVPEERGPIFPVNANSAGPDDFNIDFGDMRG